MHVCAYLSRQPELQDVACEEKQPARRTRPGQFYVFCFISDIETMGRVAWVMIFRGLEDR
jgi:hypothetical protein